ncbi:MAG: sugar-binding transcriptional regulator [Chitinophagales bacterium]
MAMRDKTVPINDVQGLLLGLERLAPEALDVVRIRYRVLKEILYNQPIGRRQIASRVKCSERTARAEIELLKEKGIVDITPAGIILTGYGVELLEEIGQVIPYVEGLGSLAENLRQRFHLENVHLVPGDSYTDIYTKKDLGRTAARLVRSLLFPGCTLAVTGGTTLAEMACAMTPEPFGEGVLVLPARGGLGEEMEEQANVIAARIAKAIGANYRLLHIADSLNEETIQLLIGNPGVAEILDQLKKCDILVHGIGSAKEMACRRGLPDEALMIMEGKKAVGEAFRYYFNQMGEIVYCLPGIGLEFEDLRSIPRVVAVAGGSNKARAIESVLSSHPGGILVTDEGAARAILERGC